MTDKSTHVLYLLPPAPAVCVAGYGIWESSACTPCNYGWYHSGGDTKCTQCPVATFYPPVDGVGDKWASQGEPEVLDRVAVTIHIHKTHL